MNVQHETETETETASVSLGNPIMVETEAGSERTALHDSAEVIAPLLARLSEATYRTRQRMRQAVWLGAGATLLTTLYNSVVLTLAYNNGQFPFQGIYTSWLLDALALSVSVAWPLRSLHQRRELVATLVHFPDARVIGPITEMLYVGDAATRQSAADALSRLLPELTPESASLLTEQHRDTLYRVLADGDGSHAELRVAVLHALCAFGEAPILPLVERLAANRARTRIERELKTAAQTCLPALQIRILREPARTTLLRGASRSLSAPHTLLRAAASPATDTPQTLVRAADAPQTLLTAVDAPQLLLHTMDS